MTDPTSSKPRITAAKANFEAFTVSRIAKPAFPASFAMAQVRARIAGDPRWRLLHRRRGRTVLWLVYRGFLEDRV